MKYLILLAALFLSNSLLAQKTVQQPPSKPKLIVGIVLDQMRWDYLYRYNDRYSNGGFKRVLREGFSFEKAHFPYVPTYTAVGHSVLYTGSVPAFTGIIGNNWYEKSIKKGMYCTSDSTVRGVGGGSVGAGQQSPRNLWASTISDELRLATNFRSKVIGIAFKDRGAILPAGHSANGAYWYDDGKWITSTFYMNQLPGWVSDFNAKDRPAELMRTDWNTLYPINTYKQSTADDNNYEGAIAGIKTTTFPHKLSELDKIKYEAIKTSPAGNTLTFEFAKAAIENENLGKGTETDLLAVSFSSPDYIGHTFGPNSIEVEDMYLRFDKEFAEFLVYLDKRYGKNNYMIFISADHGASHVPAFLNDHRIPAAVFSDATIRTDLNKAISEKYGLSAAVITVMNDQVYLSDDDILAAGKNKSEIEDFIVSELEKLEFVSDAWPTSKIAQNNIPEPVKTMATNGFNPKRSGDVFFLTKPAHFSGGKKGTTHGSWNPYDSQVPLLFFGWGIKPGKSYRTVSLSDLAPTIAAKLQIQAPNASVGHVLEEVMN